MIELMANKYLDAYANRPHDFQSKHLGQTIVMHHGLTCLLIGFSQVKFFPCPLDRRLIEVHVPRHSAEPAHSVACSGYSVILLCCVVLF